MASKLSAFPVAFLLPLSILIQIWELPFEEKMQYFWEIMICFVIGALVSLFTFRLAQPYAFNGPSLFNIGINPNWWSAISSLQAQSAGAIDWPPSIQWARRSKLFSFMNLSLWGIGLPMAFAAWVGVIWSGIRVFRKGVN